MAQPNFMLFGSGPDQLAAQQAQYSQLWTGAAEGNRASAQRAAEITLSNFLQAQQADEAARVRDQNSRLAMFEFQTRRGDSRSANAEDMRRFDIDTGLRRDALANDKLRIGAMSAKAVEADREQLAAQQDRLAKAEADAGMFSNEADVAKRYTALSKEAVKSHAARSMDVRSQLEESQSRLEEAAKAINRAKQLRDYGTLSDQALKTIPSHVPNPSAWSPFMMRNPAMTYENSRIKDWNAELYGAGYDPRNPIGTTEPNSLSSRAAALGQDKNIMAGLAVDPQTGRYDAPSRPAWLPQPTVTGTQPPAAPANNPAALIAEANAAIRAGADPARVKARLRELGIPVQ